MTPADRTRPRRARARATSALSALSALAAVAATTAAPATARAQSPEAEALFREGRRLIRAGKLAAGCDKIAASERLESSVGALLNLGDCREKLGAVASAWAAFRGAEARAKHAGGDEKRRAEAARRAALLEPRLSYLVLQIDPRAQRDIAGLAVLRDGVPLDRALWNTPIPIDPGTYQIIAEAPGYLPWRTTVPVATRPQRRLVAVPALERAPVAAAPARADAAGGDPAASLEADAAAPTSARRGAGTWSTPRKLGAAFVLAGVGALGAGGYFGWRARDLDRRSDEACPQLECGDAAALRLNDRARDNALRANVLFAASGVAAVTGAVLWLAGKPRETVIRPGGAGGAAGVTVEGRF